METASINASSSEAVAALPSSASKLFKRAGKKARAYNSVDQKMNNRGNENNQTLPCNNSDAILKDLV